MPGEELITRILCRWVDAVRQRAKAVVAGVLLATLAVLAYTALNLGVNSDNMTMLGEKLPFIVNNKAFSELFSTLDDALLVVVDAETSELARDSTDALQRRLASLDEHFEDVYVPGGSRFFEEHGLLYRSPEELYEFADAMAAVQPVLAELERDNSIANLARLVRSGLEIVQETGSTGSEWPAILDRMGQATVGVYQEYPVAISWDEVMLRGTAIDVVRRRVIVLHPKLDFSSVFAAESSLRVIREAAAELDLRPERGVRVRITGQPALNHEEMVGLLWDVFGAGLFCFALVAVLVYLALRSVRLVVAVVLNLLVGLIWTAGFAAAAVGDLNLASLSFAILFIGLGVDFGIHLTMRYADLMAHGQAHEEALREAVRGVGSSLVLCTITTAIGFYVFLPTGYRAVAELGLIAGTGMVIILVLTLSFLPALVSSLLRPDPSRPPPRRLRFRLAWWRGLDRHPGAVCAVAALAGVGALALAPQAWFEPNVVSMRDPTTESKQAFDDIAADAGTRSPWFADAVAPDLASADALAERLRQLPDVDFVITFSDFVPEDQEEKLEILGDLAMLLDAPPPVAGERPEPTLEEKVEALRELHAFLGSGWIDGIDSPLAESMRYLDAQLDRFLERLESEGDAEETLAALEGLLLSGMPSQIARLRRAIETDGITPEEIPEPLRRRMLAPDGRARVQAFPAEDLQQRGGIERFADAVRSVAPDAVGVAVNLTELGRVTVESFLQALFSALVLISLLLFGLWRRVRDVFLVMAPLLLGTALTVASMVLLGIPFSFFNVVVIPLIFGVGVDSGIHLVHQAGQAAAEGEREELLASTTARAVFYSALTTTASFGSLAFSSHLGMRSLGLLLTVGMVLTVVCNLVVLPALLRLGGSRAPRPE